MDIDYSEASRLMPWLFENRQVLKLSELIYDNSQIPGHGKNDFNVKHMEPFSYSNLNIYGSDGSNNGRGGHEDHIHISTYP